jgi:hypothetical protein
MGCAEKSRDNFASIVLHEVKVVRVYSPTLDELSYSRQLFLYCTYQVPDGVTDEAISFRVPSSSNVCI